MKLGLRIFGCYLVIFLLCFSYPIAWVLDNMRTRYLEGVEDPLVDHANILAEIVGHQMAAGRFRPDDFQQYFQAVYDRRLETRIYHLSKEGVDVQVYITDARGKVLFDSLHPENIGADYTQWRDVALTLEGRYGARTSLADPADPTSSVLYVAAPVIVEGQLAGVLTVAKPTTNIGRGRRSGHRVELPGGLVDRAAHPAPDHLYRDDPHRPAGRLPAAGLHRNRRPRPRPEENAGDPGRQRLHRAVYPETDP
jgi:hypothetical protein